MIWRLGVAGSPIGHSKSPQLHRAGLALAGLDGSSTTYELGAEMSATLREVLLDNFDALSITSPLKKAAFECCDELSEVARRTESVNSLLVRDGKIFGDSTDGEGFIRSLEYEFGPTVDNAHVVVLGAGGAASAIIDALDEHHVGSVVVHGRNEAKIEALTQRHRQIFTSALEYRPIDVLINTLPAHARDAETTELEGVSDETIVVDITYDPAMSPWRQMYETAGCRTMNGLPMLASQAALQMNWWWGVALEGAQLLASLHD